MHFLRPQGPETWNQPLGKSSKTFKFVETEEHTIKQWMGQEWDERINQKVSGNKRK